MAMNGRVQDAAERLHRLLEQADPVKDRDTVVWALGFLSALVTRLELRVPDLFDESTLRGRAAEAMDRLRKQFPDAFKELGKDPDSLEQIERELSGDEPGDAPVPARRRPGPKGLSGGAAVPFPEFSDGSDVPM
jgi:hypothetical protein